MKAGSAVRATRAPAAAAAAAVAVEDPDARIARLTDRILALQARLDGLEARVAADKREVAVAQES